jgi:hypothetical protein
MPPTAGAAVDLAIGALADLGSLGEDVDDEWQYVQDLAAAWEARLAAVGDGRGEEPLPATRGAAVVRLTEEAGRITDPHRAIDWLSTYPQAVLAALGERP